MYMADNNNATGSTTGRSGYTAEEIREMYEIQTAPADTTESLGRDGLDIRTEAPPLEGGRMPLTRGNWEAEVSVDASRGNTGWYSDRPMVNAITGGEPVQYEAGYPDFSPYAKAEVEIEMTGNNNIDRAAANEAYAIQQAVGQPGNYLNDDFSPNTKAAQQFMNENELLWHHKENGMTMQAVPRELHGNMPHTGGASGARALAEAPPEDAQLPTEAVAEPLAGPVGETALPTAVAPSAVETAVTTESPLISALHDTVAWVEPRAEALLAETVTAGETVVSIVEGATATEVAAGAAATLDAPVVAVGAGLYYTAQYVESGVEAAVAYVEPTIGAAFAEMKAVLGPPISEAVTETETAVTNVTSGIANTIDNWIEPTPLTPVQALEPAYDPTPIHVPAPAYDPTPVHIPELAYAPTPVHSEPAMPSHTHVDTAPDHGAAHDSPF
jgi:hypothetical protein